MWGAGLLMMLAYLWVKNTYWPRYFERLNYELTEENLVVSRGVYFRRQVTIPLWKVTDVLVMEGPLQRHYGIKSLRVQTAGQGHAMAEGTLLGLADPEAARQLILERMAELKRTSE